LQHEKAPCFATFQPFVQQFSCVISQPDLIGGMGLDPFPQCNFVSRFVLVGLMVILLDHGQFRVDDMGAMHWYTSNSAGVKDLYFAEASSPISFTEVPARRCFTNSVHRTVHALLGLPLGGDNAVFFSSLISARFCCSTVKTFFLGLAFGFAFGFFARAFLTFFFAGFFAGFFAAFFGVALVVLAFAVEVFFGAGVWVALVAVAYNRGNRREN